MERARGTNLRGREKGSGGLLVRWNSLDLYTKSSEHLQDGAELRMSLYAQRAVEAFPREARSLGDPGHPNRTGHNTN
jgi:hypothetical protein